MRRMEGKGAGGARRRHWAAPAEIYTLPVSGVTGAWVLQQRPFEAGPAISPSPVCLDSHILTALDNLNHGSACSRPACWRTSAGPVWKEHQPINCVHKHPPAGSQLARGRGRSREGGYGWDGQRVLHPSGKCPETHTTSTLPI